MVSIVTVNGKTHILSGNNVTINGNQIIVDGKNIDFPDQKNISIKIEGNVGELEVQHCNKLEIAGTISGDVSTTSGDIKCGDINGNVSSVSGDIKAKNILGNVKTVSGDIDHRFL